MAGTIKPARGPGGGPSPMGPVDVMETILDKGLVIDSYVTASLAGVEGLTVDARMAVASLNTYAYLCFADAAARLDIPREKQGVPDTAGGQQQGDATGKPEGVPESAADALRGVRRRSRRSSPAGWCGGCRRGGWSRSAPLPGR